MRIVKRKHTRITRPTFFPFTQQRAHAARTVSCVSSASVQGPRLMPGRMAMKRARHCLPLCSQPSAAATVAQLCSPYNAASLRERETRRARKSVSDSGCEDPLSVQMMAHRQQSSRAEQAHTRAAAHPRSAASSSAVHDADMPLQWPPLAAASSACAARAATTRAGGCISGGGGGGCASRAGASLLRLRLPERERGAVAASTGATPSSFLTDDASSAAGAGAASSGARAPRGSAPGGSAPGGSVPGGACATPARAGAASGAAGAAARAVARSSAPSRRGSPPPHARRRCRSGSPLPLSSTCARGSAAARQRGARQALVSRPVESRRIRDGSPETRAGRAPASRRKTSRPSAPLR